jgi:hypothetical protein
MPGRIGRSPSALGESVARHELEGRSRSSPNYSNFVVEYLRAEALSGTSSLAQSLNAQVGRRKDGTPFITKKSVNEKYPLSKKFLYDFSRRNPGTLKGYREYLKKNAAAPSFPVDPQIDASIAEGIASALKLVPTGVRDTFKDNRGLIIPVDDATILLLLGRIEAARRDELEKELGAMVREIVMS